MPVGHGGAGSGAPEARRQDFAPVRKSGAPIPARPRNSRWLTVPGPAHRSGLPCRCPPWCHGQTGLSGCVPRVATREDVRSLQDLRRRRLWPREDQERPQLVAPPVPHRDIRAGTVDVDTDATAHCGWPSCRVISMGLQPLVGSMHGRHLAAYVAACRSNGREAQPRVARRAIAAAQQPVGERRQVGMFQRWPAERQAWPIAAMLWQEQRVTEVGEHGPTGHNPGKARHIAPTGQALKGRESARAQRNRPGPRPPTQ